MADKNIAGALRGLVQWLGVGLIAILVVVVGLVWPEDEDPVTGQGLATAKGGGELPQEKAAAAVPEPEEKAAAPVPLAPLPDGPIAERVRIELDPSKEAEDEKLDELEAEGDAEAELPVVATVEIPRGVIRKVEEQREWVTHSMAPLESVDQVAHRYDVRPASLRLWNSLRPTTNKLKRGYSLKVKANRIPPQRVRLEYVVKPRDSWWSIGTRYGVDSVDLRSQNRDSPRRLKIGQRVRMWIDPVVFEWIAVEDDNNPQTLRPGAVGIGPPHEGQLVNGVKLPPSDYYTLRLPPSSFGTTHAVEQVLRAIVLFEARSEYPRPLTFGSMSAKHGGPLKGHRSHQTGRDLDIRLPLKTIYPENFAADPKRVDWNALWQLVTAFRDTDQAVVIFFDYELQKFLFRAAKRAGASDEDRRKMLQWPGGSKSRGFVRDSPGHDHHIHVRFSCGVYEVECTGLGADEMGD